MSGFDFNQIGNMAQGFMNSQGGGNNQGRNDNDGQQGGFGGGYGGDDNQQQQQQQHQGGGGGGGFDFGQLASMAQGHSQGNHDSGLFSQAASFLQNQGGNQNIDEQKLLQDHNDVMNNPGSNSSGQIGNAAVLSALSSVFGGGGGGGSGGLFGGGGGGGGGGFQQKLVSAAMSHAADLWEGQSAQGQAQGNKQDAVNHAAQMAMGLAMKNPSALAGLVGGGNSGGLGMLASMLK